MSEFPVKLPDVGEGVAEAELVSWAVEVGDQVTPDSALAEVLTDKATVEIACPVAGTITELRAQPGDVLAVGSIIVVIDSGEGGGTRQSVDAGDSRSADASAPSPAIPVTADRSDAAGPADAGPADAGPADAGPADSGSSESGSPRRTARTLAAPAVRQRAQALGIDLAAVTGSGPEGRVVHADLDRLLVGGSATRETAHIPLGERVEPVRGLRRKIAQRLSTTWTEIPHITYVEAVDVTELEALRSRLNQRDGGQRLTLLPFVVRAIVAACADQPRMNATYDSAAEELTVSGDVHVGIATQTSDGLVVPVVRDAGRRTLDEIAEEIARLAAATRAGTATRQELSGSTITITSLGALGGVVSTPLINAPEVAIVGVNKIETRPVWSDGAFVPRQMINLSSSFDHRIVDGWDAATFIQRIKELLEFPALLFIAGS